MFCAWGEVETAGNVRSHADFHIELKIENLQI